MVKQLEFLQSTRFWALVVIAILGVLAKEGIISNELLTAFNTILFGYVGIRTADKFSSALK